MLVQPGIGLLGSSDGRVADTGVLRAGSFGFAAAVEGMFSDVTLKSKRPKRQVNDSERSKRRRHLQALGKPW